MIPENIREKLMDLVEDKDRHEPLVFVGRDAEMSFLEGAVARAMRDKPPPSGFIRVVQGAPGMGKTALRTEFARRLLGRGGTGEHAVHCAVISAADLSRPPVDFMTTVARQCVDAHLEHARRVGRIGVKAVGLSAEDLLNMGSKAVFGRNWKGVMASARGLSERSTLRDCADVYSGRVWGGNTTVVLLLDECQNCDPESGRARDNMRDIFEGEHKARMPLLCFGLPNTLRTIQALGVSRPPGDAVRRLGLLNAGEGRDVLTRTLDELALTPEDGDWMEHVRSLGMAEAGWVEWRSDLVDRLEAASEDFPQHLAAALMAVAGAVLGMAEGQRFGTGLVDEIEERHRRLKSEYYRLRLDSPVLENHQMALGALCELFERRKDAGQAPRVDRDDALDIIEAANDRSSPVSQEDSGDILQMALGRGVLATSAEEDGQPDGRFIEPPPIPSLSTHLRAWYLECLANRKPAALALRDHIGGVMPDPATPKRRRSRLSM